MTKAKAAKIRSIILRPHEARRLAEAGRVLVVREVKPQPPALCRYEMNQSRTAALCLFDDPNLPGGMGFCPPTGKSKDHRLPCPLGPVGSVLWGREAWAMLIRRGASIHSERVPHYRADGPGISRWRSSTSMPAWASRFPRLRHTACEVTRGRQLMLDHPELGKVACEEEDRDDIARIWRHDLWAWCSTIEKEAADAE